MTLPILTLFWSDVNKIKTYRVRNMFDRLVIIATAIHKRYALGKQQREREREVERCTCNDDVCAYIYMYIYTCRGAKCSTKVYANTERPRKENRLKSHELARSPVSWRCLFFPFRFVFYFLPTFLVCALSHFVCLAKTQSGPAIT